MSIWDRAFGNDARSRQLNQLIDQIDEKKRNAENEFSGPYNTIYHHYTSILDSYNNILNAMVRAEPKKIQLAQFVKTTSLRYSPNSPLATQIVSMSVHTLSTGFTFALFKYPSDKVIYKSITLGKAVAVMALLAFVTDVITGIVDAATARDQLNDLIARAQNGNVEIDNYMESLNTNEDQLITEINELIIKTDFFTNVSHLMPQGLLYPDRQKSELDREDVYVKIRAAMLECEKLFIGIRDFKQGVREMLNDGLSANLIAKYLNKDINFITTYLMLTHVEDGKTDQQIMDLLNLSLLDVQIGRLGTIVFEHPEWSVKQILANSGYSGKQLEDIAGELQLNLTNQIADAKDLVKKTETSTATFTTPTQDFPLFLWSSNDYNGFSGRSTKNEPTKWADVRAVKEAGQNTYEMTQYYRSFKLFLGQKLLFYSLPKTASVLDTPAPADAKTISNVTDVPDISAWIVTQPDLTSYLKFKLNPDV
ncbi:3493_t:CDS:2, partial [Paraglomus occultum]